MFVLLRIRHHVFKLLGYSVQSREPQIVLHWGRRGRGGGMVCCCTGFLDGVGYESGEFGLCSTVRLCPGFAESRRGWWGGWKKGVNSHWKTGKEWDEPVACAKKEKLKLQLTALPQIRDENRACAPLFWHTGGCIPPHSWRNPSPLSHPPNKLTVIAKRMRKSESSASQENVSR